MDELVSCSAIVLARLIRDQKASSEEVVRAHLAAIEQINPALNAVVQVRPEPALQQAREADAALAAGRAAGPLHGVPMTIKDSLETAGVVTTAGSTGRAGYVPRADAIAVARLRKAGAILLGKTNTPELTLAYETDNLVYGRTNNPYDPAKTPGGSSGGAAATIAAMGAPFDLGSDTGGSLRLPAAWCGIAALKPTAGRVPRTGHILSFHGYLQALTHLGPLARTVGDLHLLLRIVAGPDGRDPYVIRQPLRSPEKVNLSRLRVAFFSRTASVTPMPAVAATLEQAAAVLQQAGATVTSATPARFDEAYDLYYALFRADGGAWVRELLTAAGTTAPHPQLSWATRAPHPPAVDAPALARLLGQWDTFRSETLQFFEPYDAILCPVHASAALPHGTTRRPENRRGFACTLYFNLTGWPAVAVRAGTTAQGMPIGVQVVAKPWREDIALALAGCLEEVLGGWQPPPALVKSP